MNRTEMLKKSNSIITGERENDYGEVENNFAQIASYWTLYLNGRSALNPEDVAAMMILLKIARLSSGHSTEDSWIDTAGYAALGCELSEK